MSNTLNLGTDGNWATKENSLLGYNSENGNYKPLPFDFTRASNGTFVNKSGLIETAASGVPRIDFLGNTSGALKLEPQRTNLIPYSQSFDNAAWTVNGASITSGFTSPDGTTNAFKLVEDTSTGVHRIYQTSTVTSSTNVSISTYVKYAGTRWVFIRNAENSVGRYFDLVDGVIGGTGGLGMPDNSLMVAMGDGWYKISVSNTNTSAARLELWMTKTEQATFSTPYIGDGTSGVYIYGAQLEQGSYATSLINTQGSAVTRVQDVCSQTVPSGIIGQTEGTIYIDVDFKTLSGTNMFVSIRPDANNKIEIYRSGAVIYGEFASNASFNFNKPSVTVGRYKIAVAYSSGSSAMYINGVLIGSNTTPFAFTSTLDGIYINSRGTTYIEQSSYNESKIYNTRLSNAELIALTS